MSSVDLMMVLVGLAVMCEQGVQQRVEHAALKGAGMRFRVEDGDAYPHSLGSARQEVQDPVTHGVEPLVFELNDQLGGLNGVEC